MTADVQELDENQADEIILDSHQEAAINFLAENIRTKKHPVVGLFGGGGTGKSTILRALTQIPDIDPSLIQFSATTNKAVSRLSEDIQNVVTAHKAICTPVFTQAYINICDFFVEKQSKEVRKKLKDDSKYRHSSSFEFVEKAEELMLSLTKMRIDDAKDEFEYFSRNHINSFDSRLFKRYKLNEEMSPNSILGIDESSMLPKNGQFDKWGNLKTIGLDTVQKVYKNVIVIGDNMQLGPVSGGDGALVGVPHHTLVKNYRADKSLERGIKWARDCKHMSMFVPRKGENVRIVSEVPESYYEATRSGEHQIVHICYKNVTRKNITKRIRGNNSEPLDGEPVIYRGAQNDAVNKGDLGFYVKKDNVMYFSEDYAQYVTKRMEMDEYTESYGMFQFAYAMTAHMSQGSEFDHVVVYLRDIPQFVSGMQYSKWVYTAVSRARKSITIVV